MLQTKNVVAGPYAFVLVLVLVLVRRIARVLVLAAVFVLMMLRPASTVAVTSTNVQPRKGVLQ